jgi:hypothetical protein
VGRPVARKGAAGGGAESLVGRGNRIAGGAEGPGVGIVSLGAQASVRRGQPRGPGGDQGPRTRPQRGTPRPQHRGTGPERPTNPDRLRGGLPGAPAARERLAEALPNAETVLVTGGHLINPAHPAVLDFIGRVLRPPACRWWCQLGGHCPWSTPGRKSPWEGHHAPDQGRCIPADAPAPHPRAHLIRGLGVGSPAAHPVVPGQGLGAVGEADLPVSDARPQTAPRPNGRGYR